MRKTFEDEFKKTMDALRFSPKDKKRITEKIIQTHSEQRRINMNKWTLPKAAAIAATCLLVTGGTVFAASKIIMYTASSNANYDYSSATEMNSATSDRQENAEVKMPDFPDSLGGYSFDGYMLPERMMSGILLANGMISEPYTKMRMVISLISPCHTTYQMMRIVPLPKAVQ